MERVMLATEDQIGLDVVTRGTITKHDLGIAPDTGLVVIIDLPKAVELPKKPIRAFQEHLGIKVLYVKLDGQVIYDTLSYPVRRFQEAMINPYDLISRLPKA